MSRQKSSIVEVLNTHKRDEIEINRKRFLIIKTILLCGRQILELRRDKDSGKLTFIDPVINDRNFRTLILYQTKDDRIMKEVFGKSAGNVQYWSSKIQNELVYICGQLITGKMVKQMKSARFLYHPGRDNRHIKGRTNGSRASIFGHRNFSAQGGVC